MRTDGIRMARRASRTESCSSLIDIGGADMPDKKAQNDEAKG